MNFVCTIFLSKNEPSISAYTQILSHKKEKKIKFDNRLPNNKVAFKNFIFLPIFKQKSCHKIIPIFVVSFQTTKSPS